MRIILTEHAQRRMNQRGIRNQDIDTILNYGTIQSKPGNAIEYRITRKEANKAIQELKREIQRFEKVKNISIIISNDSGEILTTYRRKD